MMMINVALFAPGNPVGPKLGATRFATTEKRHDRVRAARAAGHEFSVLPIVRDSMHLRGEGERRIARLLSRLIMIATDRMFKNVCQVFYIHQVFSRSPNLAPRCSQYLGHSRQQPVSR